MTEQEINYINLGYIPEQYPWLYPSLYPDATPPPVQEPDPPPARETSPSITLDELEQILDQLQTAGEAPEPSEELSAEEAALDPGDVMAVELDPGTLAIIDAIKYVKEELIQIGDEVTELQLSMDSHPMLTTPFEHYTVTEGLLLLLLLAAFLSACARMLRGGFSWLRS